MGESDQKSPALAIRQRALLLRLVGGMTLSEAAEDVGISYKTAWRYSRDEVFRTELYLAQKELFGAMRLRLLSLSESAIKILAEIAADKNQQGSVRCTAAGKLIDNSLKFELGSRDEMLRFADRLASKVVQFVPPERRMELLDEIDEGVG